MPVRLEQIKEAAIRSLAPGHPGREAILCQPDEIPDGVFDALVPTWIALLLQKGAP